MIARGDGKGKGEKALSLPLSHHPSHLRFPRCARRATWRRLGTSHVQKMQFTDATQRGQGRRTDKDGTSQWMQYVLPPPLSERKKITSRKSILTCMSPRPDLDTRFPVARRYSIWWDMLVLRAMACSKVAVDRIHNKTVIRKIANNSRQTIFLRLRSESNICVFSTKSPIASITLKTLKDSAS